MSSPAPAGIRNRSVPVNGLLAHVTYTDVAAALGWLCDTFGFVEHYRYGSPDGEVQGAQIRLGEAWLMLNGPRNGRSSPRELGSRTQSLTVFVPDVEAHYKQVKASGARVVEELNETPYGERQYVAEDPEGHWWLFSQHVRDVSPADWGARIATPL
jgi:uncharacterized glyoxalase superfamily protein PhnB